MYPESKVSCLYGFHFCQPVCRIHHRTQIDLTYNSNHIEGSRLTHEQTRFIFETNAIGITDDLKLFYYRGLREWGHINGYLTDTCLTTQDNYKALLDYFKIKYQ